MVQLPFASEDGPKLYGSGQPMGAYSSWPAFSLCHHLVVLIACKRAGFNPLTYKNYMLLGDDIVIADEEVATNYLDIMRDLGVEISFEKSLVSSDTLEFAKRLVRHGKEVSPAPLRSLLEARNNLSAVLSFFRDLEIRWNLPDLVTRPVIFLVLQNLVPSNKLMLSVTRVWETWIIPTKHDSAEQRDEKAR
jgi:hypothetical protein